jgi:outer membrane protein TolC
VLALDVDQPIKLVGELKNPLTDAPLYSEYVEQALANSPEIKSAKKVTLVAADLIKIAQGDLKPSLGLFGTYQWNAQYDQWPAKDQEKSNTLFGGLALKHQLFSGGRNWQQVKEAILRYEKAQEEMARIERTVRVNIKKQWLSVIEAQERSKVEEKAIEEAELALKATEVRYREGQASQLELTDTRLARNRVRTVYSQASYDFWVSLAGLERAAGILPEEVKK